MLEKINVSVVRSKKRKTTQLLMKNQSLIINAPMFFQDSDISFLLKKYEHWIQKNYAKQSPPPPKKHYVENECFPLRGKNYSLQIHQNPQHKIPHISNEFLKIYLPKKVIHQTLYVQKKIQAWYLQEASTYLLEKTDEIAKKIELYPQSVIIKSFKAQWGNCYQASKKIQYNWRLIMAEESIIDYVIVHELCHLIHANHSKAFWRCVEQILPHYQQSRQWLKKNGHEFFFD